MNLVRMSASVRSFLFTVVAPSALIFDALGLSQVLFGADLRRCAVRSRAFRCRSASLCVQIGGISVLILRFSAEIFVAVRPDHGLFGGGRAAMRRRSWIFRRAPTSQRRRSCCLAAEITNPPGVEKAPKLAR